LSHDPATQQVAAFYRFTALSADVLPALREQLNREAQILCLLAGADSIFYGDTLLTTGNPAVEADRELLAAAGVRVEAEPTLVR